MARSVFYYHLSRHKRPDKHAALRKRILSIYNAHKGRYGYRCITLQLRNEGVCVNHKTVEKLIHQSALKSLVRVKKYRSYRSVEGRAAPNVLCRDFAASVPNQNGPPMSRSSKSVV